MSSMISPTSHKYMHKYRPPYVFNVAYPALSLLYGRNVRNGLLNFGSVSVLKKKPRVQFGFGSVLWKTAVRFDFKADNL